MAAGGGSPRQPRRGPAPFASFDHDVSDEVRPDSSPESKLTFQLPEIREHATPSTSAGVVASESEGDGAEIGGGLPAPRIDISRASSSSHQDSRGSSPELAMFAGGDARASLDLAFREDGALELRSSTEELAFLEGAGAEAGTGAGSAPRRASRRDSQGSEAALLGVGRTSRVSSVGSQCSALSALSHVSHVSRLSVVSGVSRSPSPHRMLLETSFCGPKPIESEPDLCVAAVEERLLEIASLSLEPPAAPAASAALAPPVSAVVVNPEPSAPPVSSSTLATTDEEKLLKETTNEARAERRRARSRERREDSREQPEVYRTRNRSKDIIRIKLKPDDAYDDDDDDDDEDREVQQARHAAVKPASLELRAGSSRSLSPAPAGPALGSHSRKSSFCSLFKSREAVASPDGPAGTQRRKKSLTDGGGRSRSRERSVLSLFRGRRSAAHSPAASPPPALPPAPPVPPAPSLRYYTETEGGVIHIPLRTPPDETQPAGPAPPLARTVLPDGSVIIPLRSPTERSPDITHTAADTATPPGDTSSTMVDHREVSTTIVTIERTAGPAPEPGNENGEKPGTAGDAAGNGAAEERRRERLVFSTHVGSRDQVFSTQLSVVATPPPEPPPPLREPEPDGDCFVADFPTSEHSGGGSSRASPASSERRAPARGDSSGSDGSSGARTGPVPPAPAEEAERRGLVTAQESLDDELPYVPTTLPLERSAALPMVPVRERGGPVRVARVERPRPPAAPPLARPPPPPPPPPARADKIRISLPRRARASSASSAAAPPPPARSRSGSAPRGEWIDFEEVPERRKQPKRIQTLPAGQGATSGAADCVQYSYVPPEQCRCECHAGGGGGGGEDRPAAPGLATSLRSAEEAPPATARRSTQEAAGRRR